MEADQGWVMQSVLSRASFRRPPISGQKFFTVLSLHTSNIYAKTRGIAKKLIYTIRAIMIGQQNDLVAGDFNGTPWRFSNRDNISTIDEAFCRLCIANSLNHCGAPDRFQTTGLTSVRSLNRPIQIGIGRHACLVLSPSYAKTLGLRPTDQSCHHET